MSVFFIPGKEILQDRVKERRDGRAWQTLLIPARRLVLPPYSFLPFRSSEHRFARVRVILSGELYWFKLSAGC